MSGEKKGRGTKILKKAGMLSKVEEGALKKWALTPFQTMIKS